jgi:hypothetical protein
MRIPYFTKTLSSLAPSAGRSSHSGPGPGGRQSSRLRRSGASSSRCLVNSFSLTSNSSRAAYHSAADTTLGRFRRALPLVVANDGSSFRRFSLFGLATDLVRERPDLRPAAGDLDVHVEAGSVRGGQGALDGWCFLRSSRRGVCEQEDWHPLLPTHTAIRR